MLREMIEMMRKPSAELMAQRELEEAERQLLNAQASMEYATALVQYHTTRIARLNRLLSCQRGKA